MPLFQRTIPPFFFPHGQPGSAAEREQKQCKIMTVVKHVYGFRKCLPESHFVAVTKTCGLPRYLNAALFRKISLLCENEGGERPALVSYPQFVDGWSRLSEGRYDDDSLYFNILRKPDRAFVTPADFFPILEDIVLNHPGLRFLADNAMFQKRYIETVVCRIYYEGRCPAGQMTLPQFRKSKVGAMIKALGPNVDLNNTRDCFSYKHFYVIYCKFWALDSDHDLFISESDLAHYNQTALTPRALRRIMQCGHIAAFTRDSSGSGSDFGHLDDAYTTSGRHLRARLADRTLKYLDYIWFLMSEVDKSTPTAIEYWFRVMDEDGDGILSSYELSKFWADQEDKQRLYGVLDEDCIRFDDIMRQMNDLLQPDQHGQFRLGDLKRNGYMAERFFDTFLNFDRFQIHESYQGLIRVKRQQELDFEAKRQQDLSNRQDKISAGISEAPDMPSALGSPEMECGMSLLEDASYVALSDWCEFAEEEYKQLLQSERNDTTWEEAEEDEGVEEDDDDDDDEDDEEEDEEDEDGEEQGEKDDSVYHLHAISRTPERPLDAGELENVEKATGQQNEESATVSSSTGSDLESDNSAPSTPTTMVTVVKDMVSARGWSMEEDDDEEEDTKDAWLWQPHRHHHGHLEGDTLAIEETHDNDKEGEDRAADWIWWLSRQRLTANMK